MEALQKRIGYEFKNLQLLEEALTHPSLRHERRHPSGDNQRLEFLGDAVIELAISETLFKRLPEDREGRLTKIRALIVSEEGLAATAKEIQLGEAVQLGKSEISSRGHERGSTLADAFEALIGAIFLDSDFSVAREVAVRLCQPQIDSAIEAPESMNPKGALQELIQGRGEGSPRYSIVHQEGPDHAKHFVAEVSWKGSLLGSGSGNTKQNAEAEAARIALRSESILLLNDDPKTNGEKPVNKCE